MRKMQMALPALGLALALAAAGGCAGGRRAPGSAVWREEGMASWYGSDFHGRRTASGERYNMYAMTAAHKTLPLGTEVTVTHLGTRRRVRVRVNDRGPFVAGRIIDLSYAAARRLGSADDGVAPVAVEALLPMADFASPPPSPAAAAPAQPAGPGEPPPLRGLFSLQVGAFSVEANARRLREQLLPGYGDVRVVRFDDNRGTWWRVRAGRFETEDAARAALAERGSRGESGFVVRED